MSEAEARTLEAQLHELRDMVDAARTMPMSASVLVNRDEALALVDEALRTFPAELRHARWLLKERKEYLDRAKRTAEEISDSTRVKAQPMAPCTTNKVLRQVRQVRVVGREQWAGDCNERRGNDQGGRNDQEGNGPTLPARPIAAPGARGQAGANAHCALVPRETRGSSTT